MTSPAPCKAGRLADPSQGMLPFALRRMDVKQRLATLKAVTAGAAKAEIAEFDRKGEATPNVINVVMQETGEVI